MTEVNIIKATIDDAERIARLVAIVQRFHADNLPQWFKQPAEEHFALDEVLSNLADPANIYFLATLAGQDAGYVFAQDLARPERTFTHAFHHLILEQIGVHPSLRRQGIARALVAQVRAEARARGATGVQLTVWTFNEGSRALFLSEGFTPVQSRYYQAI